MKTIFISLSFLAVSLSGQAQKKVLIEQFTNAGCPPCATYTPQVSDYVRSNSNEVVMLSYHTSFPYLDSMYHENKAESNAAVNHYSIPGVPWTVVDGIRVNSSSSNFLPQKESVIAERTQVQNAGTISFQDVTIANNHISGKVTVTLSNQNLNPSDLILKIAVAEYKVLKSSYLASPGKNTETEYFFVMRKMLPNFDGTQITGNSFTMNFSWTLANIKDLTQLRVLSFIQNKNTKEVYDVETVNPSAIAAGIADQEIKADMISIYPNPSSGMVNVQVTDLSTGNYNLGLYSLEGKLLIQQSLPANNALKIDLTNYPTGMYIFSVTNTAGESISVKRFTKQ